MFIGYFIDCTLQKWKYGMFNGYFIDCILQKWKYVMFNRYFIDIIMCGVFQSLLVLYKRMKSKQITTQQRLASILAGKYIFNTFKTLVNCEPGNFLHVNGMLTFFVAMATCVTIVVASKFIEIKSGRCSFH